MPASEFAEWRVFMHAEPFGDARADYRHWVACDTLAQVNGNPPRPIGDYLPPTVWPDQKVANVKSSDQLRKELQQEYGS